jgi:hypothetical protein
MLVGVVMAVDEDGQKGTVKVGIGPHSSQQLSSVSLDIAMETWGTANGNEEPVC